MCRVCFGIGVLLSACVAGGVILTRSDLVAASALRSRQSLETYEKVVDIALPKQVSGGTYTYALVLRFEPTLYPESRVVILRGLDDVQVTEYTPSGGRIWDQLEKLDPTLSIEEMAKSIHIQKRSIPATVDQVTNWYSDFLSSVGPSMIELKGITLSSERGKSTYLGPRHGASYWLWYTLGGIKMTWDCLDDEAAGEPTGILPVVKWMNTVRLAVSKTK